MKILSVKRRNIRTGMLETGPPLTEMVGKSFARTLTETEYRWGYRGYTYRLLIPADYLFDGASIPRIAWTPLGLAPHGVMDMPALPHDYIYGCQGIVDKGNFFIWEQFAQRWYSCNVPISRLESDELLRALSRYPGSYANGKAPANAFQAWGVYRAVRLFGSFAWRRDDEARKEVKIVSTIKEAV